MNVKDYIRHGTVQFHQRISFLTTRGLGSLPVKQITVEHKNSVKTPSARNHQIRIENKQIIKEGKR